MADDARRERGEALRREVLGDAYVERALANRTEFNAPLQEVVNEFAWGTIWARDALTKLERSLVTLGMMAALGRNTELELHLHAALRNGMTREQLQDALLHVTGYCGFPAGVETFRIAQRVLDAWDEAGGDPSGSVT